MRKVALLLASLGIMAAAYAEQPKLEVTNVGQELYIENKAGGAGDLDDVFFWNKVGLKYGDNWTFGLQAAKRWSMDSDDGIHSTNHRIMLDAWYKVNDDLKVGARYRSQREYDRYYARYDWKHGMLWSAGDFWYQSNNEAGGKSSTDNLEMEWFPIGLQYGPFKIGYFMDGIKYLGDLDKGDMDTYLEHQIRAYLTLYKGEKLTITSEARVSLYTDQENEGRTGYRTYDDFGRNRVYLGADYQVNENLNTFIKYGWEFRDWKYEDGMTEKDYKASGKHTEDYYGEFSLGWNYKF